MIEPALANRLATLPDKPGVYLMKDKDGKVVYVGRADNLRRRVGQRVLVRADSFPGREFEGRVAHIASQAEFTPKSVQTEKSRVHTVFAVRIMVPNPDYTLKPGMPADAQVEWGS